MLVCVSVNYLRSILSVLLPLCYPPSFLLPFPLLLSYPLVAIATTVAVAVLIALALLVALALLAAVACCYGHSAQVKKALQHLIYFMA